MTDIQLPLEDIILPTAVSIWPLAWGWWFVFVITVILIVALFLLIKRHRKKWGYRKVALTLLKKEYQQWQKNHHSQQSCQTMLTILKRTAITAFPQEKVNSLYGQAWVDFLNKQVKQPINATLSQAICEMQYQPAANTDIQLIYKYCKLWIKTHQGVLQ